MAGKRRQRRKPKVPRGMNRVGGMLTAKEQAFVREILVLRNGTQAAIAAGVPERSAAVQASQWLDMELNPLVAFEVEKQQAHATALAVMNAADLQSYFHRAMQLCPGDYFTPLGVDGTWGCTIEEYRRLPREIRMLIEGIEVTNTEITEPDGTVVRRDMLRCRFVSKTFMASLAAKYGLSEKHDHNVNLVGIDWDSLYHKRAKPGIDASDPIEKRIRGEVVEGHAVVTEPEKEEKQ